MAITDGLILRLEAPTGLTNLGSAVITPTYSGGMGTVSSDGRLAFSSDGVDDFINIGSFIIPAVFPITFAYWSKSAGEARISWNRTNVPNRYIWFRSGKAGGTTAGRLTNRHSSIINETLVTTNTATDDTWVHTCYILTSATSRRVILNGDWANSVTSTANTGQGTVANEVGGAWINSFQIGASTISDGTTYFEQLTDSIRLYNRVLSEAEIQFLASARGVGVNRFVLGGNAVVNPIFNNPIQPVIF